MSRKKQKWESLNVATGVKETGIRANLPSAPSAGGGFGGSRYGGGRGGGRRRDGGSRYEQSDSIADSADSWRRNGPPARPVPRRDNDRPVGGGGRGDRGDRGDREMPRGDRGSRYPRRDRPDFDSAAPAEGNWRSSGPRPPPRTRIGIDSSANSRGWGTSSSSRSSFGNEGGGGGGFGASRRTNSSFGSSRQPSSSSNSKFSGSKKGFGRRTSVDDAPPQPRITYSKPSTVRRPAGGRFPSSSPRAEPPREDFPTLAPRKTEEAAPATTSEASKSDAPTEQNGKSKKGAPDNRAAPANKVVKKKKETPEQRARKLQRNFMMKSKRGQIVSEEELRAGIKMKLKLTDNLTDCLTTSILSEKSGVALGDVADTLSGVELASEIFIKVLGKLYDDVNAVKMSDILEESKINFDEFVPEDATPKSFYGDMSELVCFSHELNQQLESSPLESMSLSDMIGLVSSFEGKDFSLPACRKVGVNFARLLLDDADCLERGTDAAEAMKKICGGYMKKTLFITSLVEKWYQNSKPEGLDAKFQKLVDSGVIDFQDIQTWQQDQTDRNEPKRDALFVVSDWIFTMDEAQTRAREDEENEENENEDEDLGENDYAGNLFEKPKHKTYSDVIYYDT